jgi:ABC-type glycerol-3-phosphate transport system permease component
MAEAIRPVESSRPGERGLILWLTQKNRAYYLVGYLLLLALALWTLFPVYWQLATSLRADVDLFSPTVTLVPRVLTGEHYEKILGPSYPFLHQLRNSALVAVATTVVSTLLGAMAGYALTRLRFAGRTVLARLLVYAYLAPGTILFIPLFVMMSRLGLRDNLVGLTLAYLTFTVPFATWMLMGYFRTVPIELEEAALIDGASRWQVLWRIMVPLSGPALVVAAVFAFTLSWNEFLYALVLLQKQQVMTAPVGLAAYVVGDQYYWGQMMAAATIMSLPPLVIYLFGQRWVIAGWTAGAVKD